MLASISSDVCQMEGTLNRDVFLSCVAAVLALCNCSAFAQAPNSQRPGSVNLRIQATYPAADLRNTALLDLIRNVSEKSANTINLEPIAPSAAIPSYFTMDATAKGTI